MTSPIVRSNSFNGSADLRIVLQVKLLTAQRTLSQLVYTMLQKDSTSDIVLRYRLLILKNETDKAVIRSCQWVPTNTSTMSGTPVITRSSLLPAMWVGQRTNAQTGQITKIKSITPVPISRRDRLQPLRVITNKDKYCFIINCLYSSHRVKETIIFWTIMNFVTVKGVNIIIVILLQIRNTLDSWQEHSNQLCRKERNPSLTYWAIPGAPGVEFRSLCWGHPKPGIWNFER